MNYKGEFVMKTSLQLDRYIRFAGEEMISRIYHLANELAGLHILHINTTYEGGGVAEILKVLIPLMEELGIKHTWKVVGLDDESNHFTDGLVDLLQGGGTEELSTKDQNRLLDVLSHAPELAHPSPADIYFIHDFQLVPLANLYSWMQPAIWFCHVDTANPGPHAADYIRHFLSPYELCCFNSHASVLNGLSPELVQVVTLGIDPFRVKNRFLTPQKGREIFVRCGIDPDRPLISQISRFGHWKNPWQVIDTYRLVKQEIPEVQVALLGAMEAADDISARGVLAEMEKYAAGDPDIHLFSDARQITHREVNAFQRYSSVILQRSLREGFGFTVTEALWKYQPVVGTTATGLRVQVQHGYNGYLVDDTEGCADYTLKLLQDRALWRKMGTHAHKSMRKNFLFPAMVLGYLEALYRVSSRSRVDAVAD
jgi:trehalose synthase